MTNKIFGFVHMVESPSDIDLLDGRTEGRSLSEFLKLAQIESSYSLATSKPMFIEALTTRLEAAIKEHAPKKPIVHLSMHGNKSGIGFTNGDFVSWHELQEILRPVFEWMDGNLLVCLSSCSGYYGCQMAMYEDETQPFGALVGNTGETSWAEAAVGFVTFYHQFFRTADVAASVEAMKVASGSRTFFVENGHVTKARWIASMNEKQSEPNSFSIRLRNALAG